jgi:hypothetical protein
VGAGVAGEAGVDAGAGVGSVPAPLRFWKLCRRLSTKLLNAFIANLQKLAEVWECGGGYPRYLGKSIKICVYWW